MTRSARLALLEENVGTSHTAIDAVIERLAVVELNVAALNTLLETLKPDA